MFAWLRNWIAARQEQRLAGVRKLIGDGSADYVPQVGREDVLRILQRDFDAKEHEAIMTRLDEYGIQNWHREPHRVHLAVLKLSAGDSSRISAFVKRACGDFRDVIAPAEYPQFFEAGFVGVSEKTSDDIRELKESDWQQYEAWLNRG